MQKQKNRKKKIIITAALTAALLAGGTAAFAYWTNTGTGTGTASTGSNNPITVVQTSTVSNIRPGGAAQTLSGNFSNPNDGPVYVANVIVSISSVVKAVGAPAGTCDATDYVLSGATMPVNAQTPAGSGGTWTGATLAFNNKATNQDACKNATVNLAYTSN